MVGGLALVAPLTQVQDISEVPEVFKGLVIRSPALRKTIAWTIATPMGMRKAEESLREVFAPEPVPADFGTEGGGLLAMRPNNFYASSAELCELEGELEGMVDRYPTLAVPVSILYAGADNLLDARLHGERTAGDLLVTIEVTVPKELSPEARKAMEEFAAHTAPANRERIEAALKGRRA